MKGSGEGGEESLDNIKQDKERRSRMEIMDAEGRRLKGKVGDMVYYSWGGKTYARRLRIPGKRPKWETEGMAAEMVESANRLRVVQKFYAQFREKVSAEVWRLAGRAAGKRAHNLFYSLNYGCFGGDWRLTRPEGLRLTEGALLLPPGLAVEPAGGGVWRVTWEADREWASAAATDRLRVAVVYALRRLVVRPADGASGTRGELAGEFRLEGVPSGEAHAYVYFEREDGGAFSPSAHFRLAL